MTGSLGFLLVTMQPPPQMEEEFHDWYDTEHLPERRAISGFLTARRYVCIEGWPRYLAIYDLAHPGILAEEGYRAISGKRFSAWSKRILPRMQGVYRAEGVQLSNPPAVFGAGGDCQWLALLRFRGVAEPQGQAFASTAARAYQDDARFAKTRVFKTTYNGSEEFLVTIELRRPLTAAELRTHELAPFDFRLDLLNIYTRYWRHGRLHGVLSD
jgi:hypothetical protein